MEEQNQTSQEESIPTENQPTYRSRIFNTLFNKYTFGGAAVLAIPTGIGIAHYVTGNNTESSSYVAPQETASNPTQLRPTKYIIHDQNAGTTRYLSSELDDALYNINENLKDGKTQANSEANEKNHKIKDKHNLEARLKKRKADKADRESNFEKRLRFLQSGEKTYDKASDYYRKFMEQVKNHENWKDENGI